MAEQKTIWPTLAAARWRGWKIEGDGRFAVVDLTINVVRLHPWALGAQQDQRECPSLRKIYLMEHAPEAEPITRRPGNQERD